MDYFEHDEILLVQMLEDKDFDDFELIDSILNDDFDKKSKRFSLYIKHLQEHIASIDSKIDELKNQRSLKGRAMHRISKSLFSSMDRLGMKVIVCDTFECELLYSQRIKTLDFSQIPEMYVIRETIERSDKQMILDHSRSGKYIKGVKIYKHPEFNIIEKES